MPGEHLWRQQEWDRRMEASLVLPTDRSPWRAPVEHAGTCSAHWAGGEPLSILVAPHSPTCPGQSCFLLRGPKQEPRPYMPAPSHLAFPGESKRGRRPAPCRPKPQPASLTVPPPPRCSRGSGSPERSSLPKGGAGAGSVETQGRPNWDQQLSDKQQEWQEIILPSECQRGEGAWGLRLGLPPTHSLSTVRHETQTGWGACRVPTVEAGPVLRRGAQRGDADGSPAQGRRAPPASQTGLPTFTAPARSGGPKPLPSDTSAGPLASRLPHVSLCPSEPAAGELADGQGS